MASTPAQPPTMRRIDIHLHVGDSRQGLKGVLHALQIAGLCGVGAVGFLVEVCGEVGQAVGLDDRDDLDCGELGEDADDLVGVGAVFLQAFRAVVGVVGLVVAVAGGGFGGVAAAADLAVGGGGGAVAVGQVVVDVGHGDLFRGGFLFVGGLLQEGLETRLAGLDGTAGVHPEGCCDGADGGFLVWGQGLAGVYFVLEPRVHEVLVGGLVVGVTLAQTAGEQDEEKG